MNLSNDVIVKIYSFLKSPKDALAMRQTHPSWRNLHADILTVSELQKSRETLLKEIKKEINFSKHRYKLKSPQPIEPWIRDKRDLHKRAMTVVRKNADEMSGNWGYTTDKRYVFVLSKNENLYILQAKNSLLKKGEWTYLKIDHVEYFQFFPKTNNLFFKIRLRQAQAVCMFSLFEDQEEITKLFPQKIEYAKKIINQHISLDNKNITSLLEDLGETYISQKNLDSNQTRYFIINKPEKFDLDSIEFSFNNQFYFIHLKKNENTKGTYELYSLSENKTTISPLEVKCCETDAQGQKHVQDIVGLYFSSKSLWLVYVSNTKGLQIWLQSLQDNSPSYLLGNLKHFYQYKYYFSPDNKWFINVFKKDQYQLIKDKPNFELLYLAENKPKIVTVKGIGLFRNKDGYTFSPDSKRLAVIMTNEKDVYLINLKQDPENPQFFHFDTPPIADVFFSEDSNKFYVRLINNTIYIYDFSSPDIPNFS